MSDAPGPCLPSWHLWLQLEELGPGALPGPLVSTLALNPRLHCIWPPTLTVTASGWWSQCSFPLEPLEGQCNPGLSS